MTSPVRLSSSPGSPGMPHGLTLPDIIITRRTRTHSMNGRIEEDVHEGTVRFFCRSKGHGFIDDDMATAAADAKVGVKDINLAYCHELNIVHNACPSLNLDLNCRHTFKF